MRKTRYNYDNQPSQELAKSNWTFDYGIFSEGQLGWNKFKNGQYVEYDVDGKKVTKCRLVQAGHGPLADRAFAEDEDNPETFNWQDYGFTVIQQFIVPGIITYRIVSLDSDEAFQAELARKRAKNSKVSKRMWRKSRGVSEQPILGQWVEFKFHGE